MNAQQDSYGNYTPIQQPQAPPLAGGITMVINGSGNPGGVVTSLPNTLYFDDTGLVFYFTSDGTNWTALSGGGGSAVTQILAGTNITVSPAGGTGAVTINGSGGGTLTTLSGVGSPEGVAAGSPGWTYTQTDTDSFWIKITGTATNTGWIELVA